MYKLKQILMGATFALLTGLAAMSGNAIASTPDGETPANEGVCDVLQGGSPGLYGLCVAYCEAQDFDEIGDKETPNNKILANYRKKMRTGDLDMPCIRPVCPCWTDDEFRSLTDNAVSSDSCTISDSVALIRLRSPTQSAYAAPGVPICRFSDRAVTPPISVRFSGEDAISTEAAQGCYDQIKTACDNLQPAP